MTYPWDPSTWEAEARGRLRLGGQSELQSEVLSLNSSNNPNIIEARLV